MSGQKLLPSTQKNMFGDRNEVIELPQPMFEDREILEEPHRDSIASISQEFNPTKSLRSHDLKKMQYQNSLSKVNFKMDKKTAQIKSMPGQKSQVVSVAPRHELLMEANEIVSNGCMSCHRDDRQANKDEFRIVGVTQAPKPERSPERGKRNAHHHEYSNSLADSKMLDIYSPEESADNNTITVRVQHKQYKTDRSPIKENFTDDEDDVGEESTHGR